MNTENRNSDYEELMQYLEETQAYETALILFEWDGGRKPHRPDAGGSVILIPEDYDERAGEGAG